MCSARFLNRAAPSVAGAPTLRIEREMLRSGIASLACVDEVGRGALCGPVTVGVVVITARTKPAPTGVRDSKLLSAQQRSALAPRIRRWADHAVGHASNVEIDDIGIIAALRLAGHRALAALAAPPDLVLLDGSHDYLTQPVQPALFDDADDRLSLPPVVTRVKADLQCAGVAAASILAKTERDALMLELDRELPAYGLAANKGYAAAEHLDALRRLGPSAHHRISWRLPSSTVEHSPVLRPQPAR